MKFNLTFRGLLYSLLWLVFGGEAMAQAPWSPVHEGSIYTYENCMTYRRPYIHFENYADNYVDLCYRSIYVDSIIPLGSDTLYIMHNAPTPNSDSLTSCIGWASNITHPWEINKSPFVQKELIKKPNGDYILQFPDTFLLRTNAALNDSWVFNSSGTGITAIVIGLDAKILWGQVDSVKTILLSTNDTIRLSRNSGILQFPDFDSIDHSYNLSGIKRDTISLGINTPDFWDFYNFEIGDEFMYHSTYSFPNNGYGGFYTTTHSFRKVRITWKAKTASGFDYGIEYFSDNANHYHSPLNFPVSTSPSYQIDTITIPFYSDINHFLFQIDSVDQNSDLLTIVDVDSSGFLMKRLVPGQYNDQASCLYNYLNTYSEYRQGLGAVYSKSSSNPTSSTCELIGYIKNGITHGTVYSDSLMVQLLPIEQIQENSFSIRLAPNPSPAGHTQLLFDAALNAPIDLAIYNTMGQLVASQQTIGNETSLTFDYPELPKGLYLIRLKSGGKEQVLKWIIH